MGNGNKSNKIILLVEDHADTRDMLAKVLTRRGYAVRAAGGVREARVLVAADPPALLLSDIRLCDGDGCEFLLELRSSNPSICAIAITGAVYPADQVRCRAAGFEWFVAKPMEIDELLAAVEAALERDSCQARDGQLA